MVKKTKIKIRKARLKDVKQIHGLVNGYSRKGLMLARPVSYIETKIRDFFVCTCDGNVMGCVALKIWNKEWAEIIALVVHSKYQGRGMGLELTKACILDAKVIGIRYVLMLTFQHDLAEKSGFTKMNGLKNIPEVVFTEKTVNVDKAYMLDIGNVKNGKIGG